MAVNPTGGERTRAEEARIAQLYQLVSTQVPPPHLDVVIAAAARQPAEPLRQHRAPPWWHRWRVPFAVAAVAVVSVSLVTLVMDEGGEGLTSVPPTAAPVTPERARQENEALTASVESQVPERRARVAEPALVSPEPAKVEAKAAAGGPEVMRREAASAQDAQGSAVEAGTGTLRQAAPPQAAQSKVAESAGVAAERALAPMAPPLPRQDAPVAAADGRAALAARAAAPAAMGTRALEAERVAASVPPPSPEVAAHIVHLEGRAPALWVERIVTLRRDGRRAEADGLLSEFRRRFPEETLPAALQ